MEMEILTESCVCRLAECVTKRIPVCQVHVIDTSANSGHLYPGMDLLSTTPRQCWQYSTPCPAIHCIPTTSEISETGAKYSLC
jgi:hypothetical protein